MAPEGRTAWILPTALLLVTFVGMASLGLRPRQGQPVAALFPPWWSAPQSFAAAASTGGALVRTGAWPAIVVVVSSAPDIGARLRAAGAWLILNPLALACGNPDDRKS